MAGQGNSLHLTLIGQIVDCQRRGQIRSCRVVHKVGHNRLATRRQGLVVLILVECTISKVGDLTVVRVHSVVGQADVEEHRVFCGRERVHVIYGWPHKHHRLRLQGHQSGPFGFD